MTATAKKPKKTKTEAASGLGLEAIGDLAGLLDQPAAQAAATGKPIELALDLIDEEDQVRTEGNPGFSSESIAELAQSIRERGVKTPISVRPNPNKPGRYLVNHGARRTRASKHPIAGKTIIPAYIDEDYSEDDQITENIQREALTAREIADYIGRQLAKDRKKADIAKALGKSAAFISQHVTLLNLPEPVAEAFKAGRVQDVTVINELAKAYKESAADVTAWLDDETQEITRGSVRYLRGFLESRKGEGEDFGQGASDAAAAPPMKESGGKANARDQAAPAPTSGQAPDDAGGSDGTTHDEPASGAPADTTPDTSAGKGQDPSKLKRAIVRVNHDERPARLALDRRPSAEGWAWLRYEDDGHEFEAELHTVRLVSILEG